MKNLQVGMGSMRVSALFVPAGFPLNDGARHTGKYAHATGAQNGILVRDGNKKSSPSQENQQTHPCAKLRPEPVVSMDLITILAILLAFVPPVSCLRGDRDLRVQVKRSIFGLCLWGFKLF